MVSLGNFLFRYRNGLFPLAFLFLLWDGPRIFANDLAAAGMGFSVALAGQLLRACTIGLAYIIRGGRDRKVYAEELVTGGVFWHCRNPLCLGNLLIVFGLGLAANSLIFVVIGASLFFVAYLAIIAAEEDYLRNSFGQQFDDYCGRVNRLLPNFKGLWQTLHGMEFRWRRLVVKEYGSAYAWTAGMILLVAKNLWVHQGAQQSQTGLLTLFGLLVASTAAYAVARYLKKTQLLRGD